MRSASIAVVLLLSAATVSAAPAEDDDLEISAGPAKPAPSPTPAPAPAKPVEESASTKELEALRQRLAELEKKLDVQPAPAPAPAPEGELLPKGLRLSGYVQAQYSRSQLSQDQIQQGGASLNFDRFSIRRARIRLLGDWNYASFALELEGNTNVSPFIGLRRAEGSLVWRNPDAKRPPFVKATAGLMRVPFGAELPQPEGELLFLERSQSSLAFFPGAQDIGFSLSGGLGAFRYALGIYNGVPADTGAGAPLTGKPTFIGRVGAEHSVAEKFAVSGGLSYLVGYGLSAGTDATKGSLVWQDLNENGVVDEGETIGVPAATARASATFQRWAVGADLQGSFRTKLGWTRLFTEVTMASNLDRGFLIADPVLLGRDVRESGFVAGLQQELTRFGIVGFRADIYDPNSDFLDARKGQVFVTNQSIKTLSPMIGAVLPGRARLTVQYNAIFDALARRSNGVPTDLRNNTFAVRLQGDF